MATSKFIPGSDATSEEIFTYPFFVDEDSKEFIKNHSKIMFIIRGPPGTGKCSLTDLMISHFPNGMKCSANDYFTNTFNSQERTRESLMESHFYCHDRVKHECEKNTHPVIVSNTHMKKNEMQEYFNLAAKYEYTIIICSTLDKFEVSPKILAKSNGKGLNETYFQYRLKAWQDVFPVLMGWFLCPNDSSYIHYQLRCAVEVLLGDGKFCRVLDAFDTDTLLNNYKLKTLLYCIAGFIKSKPLELKGYYKSNKVRNSYGKCFTISIQAFVVTKNNIFGIVQLDDDLKDLTFKPNFLNLFDTKKVEMDNIVNAVHHMSLKPYNYTRIPLKNEHCKIPKPDMFKESSCEKLNIHNCSFIHLAQKEEKQISTYEINELFRKNFMDIDGELANDQCSIEKDGYVIYRLNNDVWVVKVPNILSVKSVFTGLYI